MGVFKTITAVLNNNNMIIREPRKKYTCSTYNGGAGDTIYLIFIYLEI